MVVESRPWRRKGTFTSTSLSEPGVGSGGLTSSRVSASEAEANIDCNSYTPTITMQ